MFVPTSLPSNSHLAEILTVSPTTVTPSLTVAVPVAVVVPSYDLLSGLNMMSESLIGFFFAVRVIVLVFVATPSVYDTVITVSP